MTKKKDHNKIWDDFQEFVSKNMSYWPDGFRFMDLNKHPIETHECIIAQTLDFFAAHEKNMKIIEYWSKWKKNH